MEDFKSLFASKTFWGAMIAVVAGVAGMFGYAMIPADQATLVDGLTSFAAFIGGAFAIYGRIRATKQIG